MLPRNSNCHRINLSGGSGWLWRACAISTSTRVVDKITREIFSTKDPCISALQDHLTRNVRVMDSANIANVIFLSGKHGIKLDAKQLTALANRLKRKNTKLNKLMLSKMLYGFRTQDDKPAYVKNFLKVLTQKVIAENNFILDGQGVGNSLYGLQRMSCESSELKALLCELRHHVEHCTSELKSQEIGNALYGLQNMSSDSKEVRGLLNALADRVKSCPEQLSAQTIGNSLYSLRHMDSSHVEVRKLLATLSQKIKLSKENLLSQVVEMHFVILASPDFSFCMCGYLWIYSILVIHFTDYKT